MKKPQDVEKQIVCPGPTYPTAFGRRSFIQVGLLGAAGMGLADFFATQAKAGEVLPSTGILKFPEGKAKSVIQIVLPGARVRQEAQSV